MRVFISSTCYDLIDLRAEIAEFLRKSGVEPILSDDIDSNFQIEAASHSIGTCLANVRSSDAFIIILSNRYGPSLEKAGLGCLSATHLEYLEALNNKIPIFMYVRDRLEADFSFWRSNGRNDDLHLPWIKNEDKGLLKLLESHRKLADDNPKNNWFWIFRDSTELKRRLSLGFKQVFAGALANKLFELGRVPYLNIRGKFERPHADDLYLFSLQFINMSDASAISITFKLYTESADNTIENRNLECILGHTEAKHGFFWTSWLFNRKLFWKLRYSILEGHTFEDTGILEIRTPEQAGSLTLKFTLNERCYLHPASELILKADAWQSASNSNIPTIN